MSAKDDMVETDVSERFPLLKKQKKTNLKAPEVKLSVKAYAVTTTGMFCLSLSALCCSDADLGITLCLLIKSLGKVFT